MKPLGYALQYLGLAIMFVAVCLAYLPTRLGIWLAGRDVF